ncbi:MAG: SufS family cysteine desulfurase [bacterium]
MNVKNIKKDFPIFTHHKNLVYLDSAATYQKSEQVIDAMSVFYKTSYASVHRALYKLAEDATEKYESVRDTVQVFINAQHREEIIFTSGTTESINFVAQAWACTNLKSGDEILVSEAEHHANMLPWQRVAQQTGAILKFIPINTQLFELENLDVLVAKKLINEKTKLVSVMQSSNIFGDIWQPGALDALITHAHALGAKVLIDAAQSVVHMPIDIQKLQPDFLAFSGHKLMGPTGIGILYIRKNMHDFVQPYKVGGSMVHSVSCEVSSWAPSPQKFEAGTPPIVEVIGLGSALDYIKNNINFSELAQHETSLCSQLLEGLSQIDSVIIAGNIEKLKKHGHIVCFAVNGIHAHDIADYLGRHNIALRVGHHCAQPLVNKLGFDALIRVSFGAYNTSEDIQFLLAKLQDAINYFKKL